MADNTSDAHLGAAGVRSSDPLSPDKLKGAERAEWRHGAHAGHLTRECRRPGPSIWIMAGVVVLVAAVVVAYVLAR